MSLVIASTTDTQEAVNAAAGIGTPPKPSEAPAQGEPEAPAEPEPQETDPDQEDEQDDPEDSHKQPKRRWGAQERISRLTRDKYQLSGQVQELKRQIAEIAAMRPQQERPSPASAQPQQQYTGEPQEGQFERYEDYVKAISQYWAAHAFRQHQQQEQQRQAQYRAALQQMEFDQRLAAYDQTAPDFIPTLDAVEHIKFHEEVGDAIRTHENPAELMHALAKEPKEFERIARLSWSQPKAAVRELGKFEARIGEQTKPPAVSKAPPPISPVGQGSTRSTKSVDDMDYDEYKRWWAKTHPGKR